jgi:myo-inositol 2-dehydrogenase / D-chiro-inositol 1-dehydrogenase
MKRRTFLKNISTATAGAIILPTIVPSTVFGKSAPSNKIQIGQIGCGRIARTHDMAATLRFDQARIIAVCDVDSKRMADGKKLVEEFYTQKTGSNHAINVKMYENYQQMLLNKDIDAVIISTPDHWHAQQAVEAALAGKDIYLQKPNSLTVTEGRIMSDVVRKQGVILQVGTQQRSDPQFRLAAELVRNGRIGKLINVKIGLPGDPSGPVFEKMSIPSNFNFDMWLGSTPMIDYTEQLVHPQYNYDRPGWLRHENYGAGMITGWGQHHYDSAAWGMDTELTGPATVEAIAEFPKHGSWNVHGDFMVKHEYENGITVYTSGGFPNGIRYEGTEGWIFVTRGAYRATPSDPIPEGATRAIEASDPKILESKIGENETHLYISNNQHGNWLDCIQSRKQPINPVEIGHRSCTVCLISHIAMKIPGILRWDPVAEKFTNSDQANEMLSRPQRYPYGTDNIRI